MIANTKNTSDDLVERLFHPLTAEWFRERFGEPTDAQRLGWPQIAARKHTLIAAPTGSGKTLAAFLACLDALVRKSLAGELGHETEVLYISPLKALSNDVHRNLEVPLAELEARALAAGYSPEPIRSFVRTGDTPSSQRQAMMRRPPHILVTTPESLYLLLTSVKGRKLLASIRTVIVDEIHALARDKRGSHLTLSLERLEHLCAEPPVRIGLSATQRPMDEIARFLVGTRKDADATDCQIIDTGHVRNLDLAVEVPPSELSAVCSNEQWVEVYQHITELVKKHRSTLIFVNTRKLAERVSFCLSELLGEGQVASHHGSLSRELRLSAEERLKKGELKAIVATASLELGIDVGYIDLVCQIGSPRSIATFLQRVGRAGHSLGLIPKGRLFPLTRDDLIECLSLIRATKTGGLDRIEIPESPLDILAQQIVAEVACEEWSEDALFEAMRRAHPYRALTRKSFDEVVAMLSTRTGRGAFRTMHLHRDQINGRLKGARGARLVAATCGGAIPDNADYRVLTVDDGTFVGTVNEDFAIESSRGDIFMLGTTSWRVMSIGVTEVYVEDANGAPATVPFWLGESPGRTIELSAEISSFRFAVAERVGDDPEDDSPELRATADWIREQCGIGAWGASQAAKYIASQKAAIGMVPTQEQIVFERFFDESGGMQLVIHSPYGARINRAWGLAMRKRFCRSFDFELQASADNNGIVLSLGPQHSFPLEDMFRMLNPSNGEDLLKQAMLAVPMFKVRFRWNATRALAVMRQRGGKRVPPPLQRFRADDFLASVFPAQTACLENVVGDIEIPDHPLVNQTVEDCLHEAMDIDRWIDVLAKIQSGAIELVPRDTREPSPFSYELLNAYPYAFLDDAPLEERRARAVATRRTHSIADVRDLGHLDADAIRQVKNEAWPLVRDAEELHEALLLFVTLPSEEGFEWQSWFKELLRAGRATVVTTATGRELWCAAERLPMAEAIHPGAIHKPAVRLPESIRREFTMEEGVLAAVRGRLECSGPVTATHLCERLEIAESKVAGGLAALEVEGFLLQGHFSEETSEVEWCERRLLARIHRLTLDGARRQIKPVDPPDFLRFLVEHQCIAEKQRLSGREGVKEIIRRLEGFQASAGAWEYDILPSRLADYEPALLDELSLFGEVAWGRLAPPDRGEDYVPSGSGMSRVVPIALVLRGDLPWLLPAGRVSAEDMARNKAREILDALTAHGALFFNDLRTLTGLLPAELDDALSELAALGLVTADGFAAIRAIVSPDHRRFPFQRRRKISRAASGATRAGRWSKFPGSAGPLFAEDPVPEDRVERWARLLLSRYGVMFRDLLARENVAPSWRELAAVYRRLEARGEVRGGRFVAGVAGEQFANPGVVEKLRQVREAKPDDQIHIISGADPLNLVGVLFEGARIPGTRGNTIAIQNGQFVASRQGGKFRAHVPLPDALISSLMEKLKMTSQVRRRDEGLPAAEDRHVQRWERRKP